MSSTVLSVERKEMPGSQEMVLVPAGSFYMGSDGGSDAESPVHRVWLDDFWIDETPVTNSQFAAFVEATGYRTTLEELNSRTSPATQNVKPDRPVWKAFAGPERAHHPVVMVSWIDAAKFAEWSGKRLPTEAEWEKAARGGLEGKLYPWGDETPDSGRVCWLRVQGTSAPPTSEVYSFDPNRYGLYDMAGNVWQWCQDWYSDSYYQAGPGPNPQGPPKGQARTRRGAAWNVREPFRLRCSNRGAMLPEQGWPNLGFRCVRENLR